MAAALPLTSSEKLEETTRGSVTDLPCNQQDSM